MATGGVSVYTSDEIFHNVCSVCKEKNTSTVASKYCVDCHDYYCSDCVDIHKTVPGLRGHKLLGSEDSQSGKLPMVPTERCDRHRFKLVDTYCQSHKAVGCYTCMAVDHRACQDVFDIPDFVKTRTNVVPEFLQRMTNTDTKLKTSIEIFNKDRVALQSNKRQEIKNIKAFTKQLEDKIKEAEKDAISEVEKRYKELDKNLQKDIDKLQKEIETVGSTKADIEATIQNESQSLVSMVRSEECASAAEEASRHFGKIELEKRVMFLLDPQNEALISTKLCLGKVVNLPYNFVHKGEFSIKCSSDTKNCNIWFMCPFRRVFTAC